MTLNIPSFVSDHVIRAFLEQGEFLPFKFSFLSKSLIQVFQPLFFYANEWTIRGIRSEMHYFSSVISEEKENYVGRVVWLHTHNYLQAWIEWVLLEILVEFYWIDPPKNSQNFVEKAHYPDATLLKISIRTHSILACF